MFVLVILLAAMPTWTAGQTQDTMRVVMTEFTFHPSIVRLASGRPVRLQFLNRGLIAHQFDAEYLRGVPVRIVDPTLHVESPGLEFLRLDPGGAATLDFLPRRKGRFAFACTIEGHREAGMNGILEVR